MNDTIDDIRALTSRAARLASHAEELRLRARELKPHGASPPVTFLAHTIAVREALEAKSEASLAALVASRACDDLEQQSGDELALRACPRRLLRALESIASTASVEAQEAIGNSALRAEYELRARRKLQDLPPPLPGLGHDDFDDFASADLNVACISEPAHRVARFIAELRHFYAGTRLVVDSTKAERERLAILREEEAALRDTIAKYGHEVVSPEA